MGRGRVRRSNCPSDESDDSIEDTCRGNTNVVGTFNEKGSSPGYTNQSGRFGAVQDAHIIYRDSSSSSSSPAVRMEVSHDDDSHDSNIWSLQHSSSPLHHTQSYDDLALRRGGSSNAVKLKQRCAMGSSIGSVHPSMVNHHHPISSNISTSVTPRNRMSSLASRRYHRSQSTSDLGSPRHRKSSSDKGKTRDQAALRKLRNAFTLSKAMAMHHLPSSRHGWSACAAAQEERGEDLSRGKNKSWIKIFWWLALFLFALTYLHNMVNRVYASLGPAHNLKGGKLGRYVDSTMKLISTQKSKRKIAKRRKRLEDMEKQIRTLLEYDAMNAIHNSRKRKGLANSFDIPRHILWSLRHNQLESNHEALLEKWESFILSHDSVISKVRDRNRSFQQKSAKSSSEFHRIFAFGNRQMRSSLYNHNECAGIHQAFVALSEWDDRVSLWSICDLYRYGGAFVSEHVSDLLVPLHEIVEISEKERQHLNGPFGCAIMRPTDPEKDGMIGSVSVDLAMIAVSPRHPALLTVIEKLSDKDSVQKLLKRSSNPSRIIADMLYDVIASQVGPVNLVKQVQDGGGTIHANNAALGSWKLLIEECSACETGLCCKVYEGGHGDGSTVKKGVATRKDFGRVVMTVQRDTDIYAENSRNLVTSELGVEVSIRESKGTPKLRLREKKPLHKILRRTNCEASWLCNRCLRYSGLGSLSSCSLVCNECYEDIICAPPAPKKEIQMKVIINVEKKNKDESKTTRLIPRIIHQTWFENLTEDQYPNLVRLQNSWIASGWEYRFYDDADARKFIADNYPDRFVRAYDSLIPGAYKADFFRYLVLLKSGGVYADVDILLSTHLDTLIPPDLSFFVPLDEPGYESDERFCLWNGLMGASPGHPFMVRAVERSLNMILNRADAFDIEQETCQISGREMDYWKLRLSPPLNMCGPCALGMSVNEALGRDSLSKYEVGLMKSDHNGYRWGTNPDNPGHLNFNILQANKEDLGLHRFTDVERDVIVASTDISGVNAKDATESIRKNGAPKKKHYSETLDRYSVW
eukprot:CAMPEP_0196804642 /NCGR_PEP_ID=MMETSP1362-20130617/4299_1 /TAXON_ID=163516 /ORGANISM="Leptocylindrus danicus, Strain CCMP1856" /LENGTH=1033 /DNA_ID=CAMNT_0042177083 /DNA_START=13 /DNA_END=3111 /DNA_ORIENTATION=-